MNNLKRVLSLGLTGAMLTGMMVMGAGAANFGDADKITHTEAVNTMVALGVLKGKDTGNYDPQGIVTRAEMAKMLREIQDGSFAKEWTLENMTGRMVYNSLLKEGTTSQIEEVGSRLRAMMPFLKKG